MQIIEWNIAAAWLGIAGGVLSGAVMGIFFHKENWCGGYNSWQRRLIRLGHISFFGIAAMNLAFAGTAVYIQLPLTITSTAGVSFLLTQVLMPLCCFLAAWKKPLRHLFPLPVISFSIGVIATLYGIYN